MPRGISVHVGVNQADPVFQVDTLKGCVNDAHEMCLLAQSRGFEAKEFLEGAAKFESVVPAIEGAARELNSGDIFLFTFAGHGSFVPSLQEDDSRDETILLHDCVLVDNYLRLKLWSQFKTGVRILGVADSCHSGTAMFALLTDPLPEDGLFTAALASPASSNGFIQKQVKKLSEAFHRLFADNSFSEENSHTPVAELVSTAAFRDFSMADRDRIIFERPDIHELMRKQLAELSEEDSALKATLLTLAACGDLEKARDGFPHGQFTQALLDVMKQPTPPGPPLPPGPPANYDELIARITTRLAGLPQPAGLSPQHPVRMPLQADAAFLAQQPFSI